MKRSANFFFALLCAPLLCAALASAPGTKAQTPAPSSPADGDQLVYADFENAQDKRPLSKRGGFVQLVSYQESTPSRFKGLEGASPAAPEIVRLKPDDPNHAIAFDYQLLSPNAYAGVGVEVHGLPDKDGKPAAEDLSGYKFLSMQVYAKGAPGVSNLRVEIMSRGQGINLTSGFPQMVFKVKEGFNTYKIPLSSLKQPTWAATKVSTQDVLKKLTAISLTAACERCTPLNGTVVVDNITFQK
ncbi:MAG TPA: hypothetical protein VN282_21615 [Pyrinomonadaceae bacterium]|nr:hypothetical protein [Pyrinomonadaceae bacterium]